MDFYLPERVRLFSVYYDVVPTFLTALNDNGGATYLDKQSF
jgi:hypothetical protein